MENQHQTHTHPPTAHSVATEGYGTTVTYPENLNWQPVFVDENGKGIFVCLQHGSLNEKGPVAFLMKYSAGVVAPIHTHTGDYWATIVKGKFKHYLADENEYKVLEPGAMWFQKGGVPHGDRCVGDEDCIISNFWPNGFDVHICEEKN